MNLQINLLPPEVLERRRWEKWYKYLFFGFFVLLILLLLIAAWLWLMTQTKVDSLQGLKEQSQQLEAQASAFSVFEKKQQELVEREAIATTALAGRVNMGRLADEISLVLPEEIWLEQLNVSQIDGLSMTGLTPLSSSQSASIGYKSVARCLVRLDTLSDLSDVWLTTAVSDRFTEWQLDEGEELKTDAFARVVRFQISGKVVQEAPAPAPASQPTSGTVQ